MTIVIISSNLDPASKNIKERLIEQSSWESIDTFDNNPVLNNSEFKDVMMITIKDKKIFRENLDEEIQNKLKIKPDVAIFISRHTSEMKKPTLTVHPVGNYGDAKFGGKSKTVVNSSPHMMTNLLRLIKQNYKPTDIDYQICFEVTHHGPYLKTPSFFVEIGSTEKEWNDKASARVISKSILDLLDMYLKNNYNLKEIPVLIGIGGGHYAPRFSDVVFEKTASFGHMIPTYQINAGNINDEVLIKTIKATPGVKAVYFHRKALKKSQIRDYKNWFSEKGIPTISSKELSPLM
jgi:D-aminoacyl-tRNA deacylase